MNAALTGTDVTEMLDNSAFGHVFNRGEGALLPVVKIMICASGAFGIKQPNGAFEQHADPSVVAKRVNSLLGLPSVPVRVSRRKRPYTFSSRHRGGLHVFFTSDENQCVVVWRTQDVDSPTDFVTVTGTLWAAWEAGEIEGHELSPSQIDWLASLIDEANTWQAELEQRGKLLVAGGKPDLTPRSYIVPVRTKRGVRTREVKG